MTKYPIGKGYTSMCPVNSHSPNHKIVVLSSGGIDSTTVLAMAVNLVGKDNVISLSITYGQKHIKEIEAARKVAEYYDVQHIEKDLSAVFDFSTCSLLQQSKESIVHESYSQQLSERTDDTKPVSTYVPYRNGLFLSCAAAIALSLNAAAVAFGAHADDAAGSAYPDCSVHFADAINEAIYVGTGKQIQVWAPLVQWNKARVVKEGLHLKAPYALTWSCYEGGEVPCGKCGTCIDRAAAFAANDAKDPALK